MTQAFIERRIHVIHGQKVMFDSDLAELYQVSTKVLNQAIQRNKNLFPSDFMFKITLNEATCLKSQFVTSNVGRGGRRKPSYVFTELGVAMLSSVLNSDSAIQTNIFIMRAFVKLHETLATHVDLAKKIEELEKEQNHHGKKIVAILGVLKQMIKDQSHPKSAIGFQLSRE